MKKKNFYSIFFLAIVAVAAWNMNFNSQTDLLFLFQQKK